MGDNKEALLAYLQLTVGCIYLSDLHTPERHAELAAAVAALRTDAFSPEAWRVAAAYITGQAGQKEEAAQARGRLLAFLTRKA